MSLEAKHYVATESDIQKLAAAIIDADQTTGNGRGTYLRALVATSQRELGADPRQRNGNGPRLSEAAALEQLTAFQTVAERFHKACVKVARATVPEPDTTLIRQRTAFARSAASTVRGYIRAGNDITLLAAHKATKRALATPVVKRRMTVDAMRRKALALSGQLERLARNLQAANREAAAETLGPMLARLAKVAGQTASAPRIAREAAAEHRAH